MKHDIDYYQLASGLYLNKDLPDNYLELDDNDFHGFLEANAWQPFEGHRGENIAFHIENLARTFEDVARDTRKKVLDEVRDKLNIK